MKTPSNRGAVASKKTRSVYGSAPRGGSKYGYDRFGNRYRNRPFDDYVDPRTKSRPDGDVGQSDDKKPVNGPYDDQETGEKVAYDEYGRLLKPAKPARKRPPLSRNTKAKLWSKGVGIAASLLGLGGAAAAAASMAADPREREAAIRGNVDRKASPLREPSGDDRSTFQKISDRMSKAQTGHDDYYGNDFDDDYDNDRRLKESVVREAVGKMDNGDDWKAYDDTKLEFVGDRILEVLGDTFDIEDYGDHVIIDTDYGRFRLSMQLERVED